MNKAYGRIVNIFDFTNRDCVQWYMNFCWYALEVITFYFLQYLGSINTCDTKEEDDHDPQNVVSKRRKVVVSETEEESINNIENKILDENTGNYYGTYS